MKVYCIFDKVAKEGSSLIEAKNDGVARRIVDQTIEKYRINRSEIELVCLGEYDADQPLLDGLLVPERINLDVEDVE